MELWDCSIEVTSLLSASALAPCSWDMLVLSLLVCSFVRPSVCLSIWTLHLTCLLLALHLALALPEGSPGDCGVLEGAFWLPLSCLGFRVPCGLSFSPVTSVSATLSILGYSERLDLGEGSCWGGAVAAEGASGLFRGGGGRGLQLRILEWMISRPKA